MSNYTVRTNDRFPDIQANHYIEITEGKLANVCFNFGKIQFLGEDQEGNGIINYDFDILYIPDGYVAEEDDAQVFSDILKHILEGQHEEKDSINET